MSATSPSEASDTLPAPAQAEPHSLSFLDVLAVGIIGIPAIAVRLIIVPLDPGGTFFQVLCWVGTIACTVYIVDRVPMSKGQLWACRGVLYTFGPFATFGPLPLSTQVILPFMFLGATLLGFIILSAKHNGMIGGTLLLVTVPLAFWSFYAIHGFTRGVVSDIIKLAFGTFSV